MNSLTNISLLLYYCFMVYCCKLKRETTLTPHRWWHLGVPVNGIKERGWSSFVNLIREVARAKRKAMRIKYEDLFSQAY